MLLKDLFMNELEEDCQLPESGGGNNTASIDAEQDGTIGKSSKPTQTGINNLVQNEKALMEATLAAGLGDGRIGYEEHGHIIKEPEVDIE